MFIFISIYDIVLNVEGEMMENKDLPFWILNLEKEELSFIKKFIMSSGSLKSLAEEYNVSYPTVRMRLNSLIQKIELASENNIENQFIYFIKNLAIDDKLSVDTAKLIIDKYTEEE